MTAVGVLPVAGDVLFDARNDGRSLRVNWHPVDDLCVLSMWRAGRCVATFQLPRSQTLDLINSLVQGLVQGAPEPPPQPWSAAQLSAVPPGRTSILRRLRAAISRRLDAWRPDRGED